MTRNSKKKAMASTKKASTLQAEAISTKKDPILSLKQKNIHGEFPTELKTKRPVDIGQLSLTQFNAELEKGYRQIQEGNGIPASIAFENLWKKDF